MLGGKSLANDTSHCGHSLAGDGSLLWKTPRLRLKMTLWSLSHMVNEQGSVTLCSEHTQNNNNHTQKCLQQIHVTGHMNEGPLMALRHIRDNRMIPSLCSFIRSFAWNPHSFFVAHFKNKLLQLGKSNSPLWWLLFKSNTMTIWYYNLILLRWFWRDVKVIIVHYSTWKLSELKDLSDFFSYWKDVKAEFATYR